MPGLVRHWAAWGLAGIALTLVQLGVMRAFTGDPGRGRPVPGAHLTDSGTCCWSLSPRAWPTGFRAPSGCDLSQPPLAPAPPVTRTRKRCPRPTAVRVSSVSAVGRHAPAPAPSRASPAPAGPAWRARCPSRVMAIAGSPFPAPGACWSSPDRRERDESGAGTTEGAARSLRSAACAAPPPAAACQLTMQTRPASTAPSSRSGHSISRRACCLLIFTETRSRRGGFPSVSLPDLGSRELVDPALMSGLVQVVPEYSGSAPEFVSLGRLSVTSSVTATSRALAEWVAGRGLVAGRPSAAQDSNVIVVTAATAARNGLRSIAGLARWAPRLVFGGPPECPERVYCLRAEADSDLRQLDLDRC